jgi:hypothetical protein
MQVQYSAGGIQTGSCHVLEWGKVVGHASHRLAETQKPTSFVQIFRKYDFSGSWFDPA